GYVGWRQWQQAQGGAAEQRNVASLQQRVATLETTLTALDDQRGSLNQRLDDAAQVNRSLREELLGQAERTRHLEDAVAKLAEKSLSGRDGMLLDEAESLLRMAGERYTLFHDAQGAAAAYALADQTLAAVNDGAFSSLRQSVNAEREALVKSQPASQAGALQQLVALRGALATLPLKPLDSGAT
ncbi:uroporphyrin-III C-methyltransferase, partial [Rhodanobacter denitrificans]